MLDLRPLLFEKIKLTGHVKGPKYDKTPKSRLIMKCEARGIKLFNEFYETNVTKLKHPHRTDDAFPIDFANKRNVVGDIKTYVSMNSRGLFVGDDQIRVFKMAMELGYPRACIVYINRDDGESLCANLKEIRKGRRGILGGDRGYFLKYEIWSKIGHISI